MSKVNLTIGAHDGAGTVLEVDGVNVAPAVRRIDVRAAAGQVTEVHLELAAVTTVVNGDALLLLSAYAVKVLAAYGWNPPEDADVRYDGSVRLLLAEPETADA